MIRFILRWLHFFGGDELLLKISIAAATPFFTDIVLWPSDGERVHAMLFASSEFHRDSFLASWRADEPID